jgi:hypothetical protein
MSHRLVCQIASGDLIQKPGWIRMSIHPTTTTEEIQYVCDSILSLAQHHKEWSEDYEYHPKTNEFSHKATPLSIEKQRVSSWFSV